MGVIKVVIVDNQKIFRDGIKYYLLGQCDQIIVSGEADTGDALFLLLKIDIPDVLLISLPDESTGISIITQLKADEIHKNIKTIILSSHSTEKFGNHFYKLVIDAFEAGVDGLLGKNSTGEQLCSAINQVSRGNGFVIDDTFNFKGLTEYLIIERRKLISDNNINCSYGLSKREIRVIELIAQGLNVKEVSQLLNISEDSINTCKEKIRTKIFQNYGINICNTMEMVLWAIKNKLIKI
jgi:DNA-binding NarL/FixJ family response regulator